MDFPACSRVLMILAQNCEGRRLICRSGLLQLLIRHSSRGHKVDVPFLDLLLSVTAFPDGQVMVHQVPEMQQHLCDLATAQKENKRGSSSATLALAVLRNLAMSESVGRRMLSSESVVGGALESGLSSVNAKTVSVALQLTWAMMAHASAKARLSIREGRTADLLMSVDVARKCQETPEGRRLLNIVVAIINM